MKTDFLEHVRSLLLQRNTYDISRVSIFSIVSSPSATSLVCGPPHIALFLHKTTSALTSHYIILPDTLPPCARPLFWPPSSWQDDVVVEDSRAMRIFSCTYLTVERIWGFCLWMIADTTVLRRSGVVFSQARSTYVPARATVTWYMNVRR